MYKECKTAQSIQRQRHIEETLLEMMKKKDFRDIKVNELCDEATIPRKAFYRYFDSKEDVLYALVDHMFLEMAERHEFVRKLETMATVETMEVLFNYWYEYRDLIKALDRSGNSSLLLERSFYWDMKKNNMTINNFDEQMLTRKLFMFTGMYSLIFTWIRIGSKSAHEMAEMAVECLTEPLIRNNN